MWYLALACVHDIIINHIIRPQQCSIYHPARSALIWRELEHQIKSSLHCVSACGCDTHSALWATTLGEQTWSNNLPRWTFEFAKAVHNALWAGWWNVHGMPDLPPPHKPHGSTSPGHQSCKTIGPVPTDHNILPILFNLTQLSESRLVFYKLLLIIHIIPYISLWRVVFLIHYIDKTSISESWTFGKEINPYLTKIQAVTFCCIKSNWLEFMNKVNF